MTAENRMTGVTGGGVTASFAYDGDGNRVRGTVNGVTTVYIGSHYEWTGSASTAKKYYYAGSLRMAVRTGASTLNFLLGDHLGSTSIAPNSSGGFVSEVRYLPFGQDRYTSGTTPTTYRFTGQRQEAGLGGPGGLYFFNARWLDPLTGRFASADSIVPEPGNPQALNRYSMVRNNPLRYVDPTGHMPSDGCSDGECEVYDPQLNRLRQDWLFSKIFLGSGRNGAWTTDDWNFYFSHRDELWARPDNWINADGSGWEGFAVHTERLASLYGPTQKEQFIRDFGLMFAGLNYELPWYQSAIEAAGGPKLPFLSEGNTGLASKYKDSLTPGDNQSHHYAAMFFLSYFVDPEAAMLVNYARDPDNPGDVTLGNRAATQAYVFRFYSSGPAVVRGQIEALRVSDDKRRHSQ